MRCDPRRATKVIVKLRLTAVSDPQHGGFTAGSKPSTLGVDRRSFRQLDCEHHSAACRGRSMTLVGGVVAWRPSAGGAAWPALLVTFRRSHTTGMQSKVHPTYKTKYRVANWPAYNRALVRRGDVTVWLSSAAALFGSRHRDRPDPAASLPSPAAPGRRVPARAVRDDAPRPLRPRLYDALPAQSAFEAPSATGPARRGRPSRARQHGSVPRRGR